MSKVPVYLSLLCVIISTGSTYSQEHPSFELPQTVEIELNRLEAAYQLLDLFSNEVWDDWDDHREYPILFNFQNGLRILIGHPSPPEEFVPYPEAKIDGLSLFLDTTKLNNFTIKLPLLCGGGILTLGSFNNSPVTIVSISFMLPGPSEQEDPYLCRAEMTILTFIHELTHCYEPKIREYRYGNLMITPDLNFALYSDIEGQALLKAYEKNTLLESLPFIKDFCVARSLKLKDLSMSEKISNSCDEFAEGLAVYSEFTILTRIREDSSFTLSVQNDPGYNNFMETDSLMNFYIGHMRSSHENTFELHEKTYWYGCLQALLLQRYFPGWQEDIEKGYWLDQEIRKRAKITEEDSILAIERFKDIYNLDSLKNKHETAVNKRDNAFKEFDERKGIIYLIDFRPVSQFPGSLVDQKVTKYSNDRTDLYPEGINELGFDDVSVSFKPVPVEIISPFLLKAVDTYPVTNKEPYEIKYRSKDSNGNYYEAVITTPVFILKAPKVTINKYSDTVKFTIESRI